jgi:predicted anti-sigma-YlaC factor YlaD
MSDCEPLRPQLSRVAEGEAGPDEAMRVARHLSDCTACRIQLARERRLAAMLEDEWEDQLHVGEGFVRSVMDNLPQGPPPRRKKRRHLKLAGLAGMLAVAPLLAARAIQFDGLGSSVARLPGIGDPDLGGGERLVSTLVGVVRSLPVALDSLSAMLPTVSLGTGFVGITAALVCSGLVALGCGATLVALATTTGLLADR